MADKSLAPPRRRRCGPKVKSGCQTCKIRRVKCDEAKPTCQRCASTGRKCDGYPQVILGEVLGEILASSSSAGILKLVARVPTTIPGTAEEKRGFSYFLHNTAAELSGYYDSSFWESLLLQASTAEPALRHAVIAIGALHESFANKLLDYSPDSIERGFSINQYTKAIGHLRRSLAAGNQQPLTALMSCILFVCFDSIRGHLESAMVHLQSGLRILRDLRIRSAADEHIIAKSLAPAFMRLAVQSILYMDTTRAAHRKVLAAELTEFSSAAASVPETFSTLEEARDCLNRTVTGLFGMFYMYDSDLPFGPQSEIFPLHEKYSQQLRDWHAAFEIFMAAKGSGLTSRQIRGAAMLKVQHTTCDIMSRATPPRPEDPRTVGELVMDSWQFEPFISEFQTIIGLSSSLIAASEEDAKLGKPPFTFSTDLGLIAPLFHCGLKCPDPPTRKAAVDLLERCQRREGMWDSATLESLVKGYWGLEEVHEAMQNEIGDDDGPPLSLGVMVDLVFEDGMKWEWRWKNVSVNRDGITISPVSSIAASPDDGS